MAEENKDTTVEVKDDNVVTVDISEIEGAVADDGDSDATIEVKDTKEEGKESAKPSTRERKKQTEDAAAALQQAINTAEEARDSEKKRREAAEATAQSERRGREEALRAADAARQEAQSFRNQAEEGQLAAVSNGIENATQRIASAKAELRRSYEAADFDKVSDAQEQLALAAADLKSFTTQKSYLESNAARKPSPAEGRVEAPPASAFEQYVAPYTPRSQAWLRAHPDCVPPQAGGDKVKNAKMMAGHYDAEAQGISPDSDEYFKIIEEHIGVRTPDVKTPLSQSAEVTEAKVAPKQKAVPVAAPVSRDPPSPNTGQRSREVVLSPQEQEMALVSFPQLTKQQAFAQYAKNKIELEAEGKLGRYTH